MCGLCGALGGAEPWTSGAGRLDLATTRRGERLERVRVSNAVLDLYRIRLDDWQGSSLIVSSATGQREIVTSLPEVWQCARRWLGRDIDPLQPQLLERLEQSNASG
jgi:hypothetical protein